MLCYERSCTDDALLADYGVAQDCRTHADQCAVADAAAVDSGRVPDADARAEYDGRACIDVKDRSILDVAALTDFDEIVIGTQHDVEPNAHVAAEHHLADDGGIRCDVVGLAARLHAVLAQIVNHPQSVLRFLLVVGEQLASMLDCVQASRDPGTAFQGVQHAITNE